jgi:hypothetical protein
VGPELEDRIVRLRKTLSRRGLDAGADTIGAHLAADPPVTKVPAVSTIWRILTRRSFVTPQPQKRPRSSWKRFCAELPNYCWQADVTHWHLAHGGGVEILNILDDHSRLAIASLARRDIGGPDVVNTFTTAFTRWGTPASVLTDNGAIFTGAPRRGAHRPGDHPRRAGHQIPKLPALPSADLRQNRALPPNPKEMAHRPSRHHPGPAPNIARRVHRLLQQGAPTSGHRQSDPDPALQRPTQATATGYLIPAHCRVRTEWLSCARCSSP